MTMLCPTAMKELLNQANTGGVDSTLLISKDGSVMAHSGKFKKIFLTKPG